MVEQAGVLALPETELRAEVWTADATATLPALSELVGLDAVLLACVSEHKDPSARVQQATLVAAPRDGRAAPGRQVGRARGLRRRGAPARRACRGGGRDPRRAGWGTRGRRRAPWAAPGWFQAAERWLHGSLATLGYAATGPVQQLRAWELSCILRTPTAQGDVYFKAVGSPSCSSMKRWNPRWPRCSRSRARPLAIDAEHRWVALADFGAELGWDAPVEVREDVLRTFARLQIEAVSQVDRLLGAGCLDRRLAGWPPRRNAGCRRSTR